MTIYTALNGATEETRSALIAAYAKARSAGDATEMSRLEALVVELDRQRRKLALGALADAVAAVEEIRAQLRDPAAGPDRQDGGQPQDDRPGPDDDRDAADDGGAPVPDRIAWGAVTRRKHGEGFNHKVRAIAGRLGCDANHLMAAMAFETAETFSPAIRNGAGSGATGLIQFMPSTAKRLGTTTDQLAAMTALDQLDYVEAYFRSATGRQLRTLSDVYMAILWPVAVGKADSHVLFRKPGRAYTQNRGFDVNGDGVITKAEAAAKVQQKLVKGMKEGRIG